MCLSVSSDDILQVLNDLAAIFFADSSTYVLKEEKRKGTGVA